MSSRVAYGSMAVLAFTVSSTLLVVSVRAQERSSGQQGEQSQTVAQGVSGGQTDANREELANFDRFLDSHPILERELESNPSLVNDANYVQSEPDLQIFLSHHPNVKAEVQRDPSYLQRHKNPDLSTANPSRYQGGSGVTSADTQRLDQFLDTHRDVALQLKQNPALIDDSTFLGQHADLQAFLNSNPGMRNEIAQNPRYLTQHQVPENDGSTVASGSGKSANAVSANSSGASLAANTQPVHQPTYNVHPPAQPPSNPPAKPSSNVTESKPASQPTSQPPPATANAASATSTGSVVGKPAGSTSASISTVATRPARSYSGVTPEDVARLNQFLEDHRDIAKRLEKNPLLVTDHKFLDKHKDVRRFFDENVRLRELFAEDPGYFAGKSAGAEAVSGAANRELGDPGPSGVTGRDLLEMEKFLKKHKDISRQLDSSPALGRDPEYLKRHKDLRQFFDEHAHIQAEFDDNPRYFMQREGDLEREANVQIVNR